MFKFEEIDIRFLTPKKFRILSMRAEEGKPVSQYAVGLCYWTGKVVQANPHTAVEWFEKAAARENPHAQFQLSRLYGENEILHFDLPKAIVFEKAAADQGLPDALFARARRFQRCDMGVRRDMTYALQLYWRAARGNVEAHKTLAVMYQKGDGVQQNMAQSYLLLLRLMNSAPDEADWAGKIIRQFKITIAQTAAGNPALLFLDGTKLRRRRASEGAGWALTDDEVTARPYTPRRPATASLPAAPQA